MYFCLNVYNMIYCRQYKITIIYEVIFQQIT